MVESLSRVTLGEVAGWIAAVIAVISGVIQMSPIKVNPWTWLAKKIGRAVNIDVLNEIDDIKHVQKITQDKLDKHIQNDDERDANMHRQRILRFNTELMRGDNYPYEYFVDMLRDIDEYERYCENHPGYKNNRAVMAIANIKRVYEEHTRNGDFLGGV